MSHLSGDIFVAFLAASLSFISFVMSGAIQGAEVLPTLLFSGVHVYLKLTQGSPEKWKPYY